MIVFFTAYLIAKMLLRLRNVINHYIGDCLALLFPVIVSVSL